MIMEKDEMIKKLVEGMGLSMEGFIDIAKAVTQVYPMIIYANLTKNTYSVLRNEHFLCNDIESSGRYDDLIDDNVENIHSNYQRYFQKYFSREYLLEAFQKGKTEVYAELYQKNRKGQYQWVSTHAIKVEDESGDITHICLNRVLDGIVEEKHVSRK
jgi:hypothetical protein